MIRNFVAELAARHNSFVQDTTKEFFNMAGVFEQVQTWSVEADRKLTVCETTFVGHDQRIGSNDVWLKTVCTDVGDHYKKFVEQTDELKAKVKEDIKGFDDRLHEVVSREALTNVMEELEVRLKQAEPAIKGTVRLNVLDCLNVELAPKILELSLIHI